MDAILTELLDGCFAGWLYNICHRHNSKELILSCKKKRCFSLLCKCVDLLLLSFREGNSLFLHHLLISGKIVCTGYGSLDSLSEGSIEIGYFFQCDPVLLTVVHDRLCKRMFTSFFQASCNVKQSDCRLCTPVGLLCSLRCTKRTENIGYNRLTLCDRSGLV